MAGLASDDEGGAKLSEPQHNSVSARESVAVRQPRTTVAQLFLRAILRWQRNRAMNHLSLLDDRQLDDIGISRNDIPRVIEDLFRDEEVRAKPLPGAASLADTVVYRRAA